MELEVISDLKAWYLFQRMTLDNVVERVADGGNMLGNLSRIKIATWQTAAEVFRAWQEGAPVKGVNTANLAVYRLVYGEDVVFDLLGKPGNPFMDERFREAAYDGIVRMEFFTPQGEMKRAIVSAITSGESTTVRYSELQVKTDGCSRNYGYIEAGKRNTAEENQLFSAVYGTENPGAGKRIYMLRESVVKSQLEGRSDDIVAGACYFYNDRSFNAGGRDFYEHSSAVRGVRRDVSPKGDAPECKDDGSVSGEGVLVVIGNCLYRVPSDSFNGRFSSF